MKVSDIAKIVETMSPISFACDWDNPGLQVGSGQTEVSRIMLAVDATDGVIDQAIDAGAELLLTHHPMLFNKIGRVTDASPVGRRILKLAGAGVSCYALHTNFDVKGMADAAADLMKLTDRKALEPVGSEGEGIGRTGRLPHDMTLRECAEYVKKAFDVETVKVCGDPEAVVSMAALCPGAGRGMSEYALEEGAQVLITGDIDHHTGIDSRDDGLFVIDAGHYGIEKLFVNYMKNWLEEKCPGTEIVIAKESDPFIYI